MYQNVFSWQEKGMWWLGRAKVIESYEIGVRSI